MDATLNVYLVRWKDRDRAPWDTYDAMVVMAETEEDARWMHPEEDVFDEPWGKDSWAATPDLVKVTTIGTSAETEPRIVLKSFNAG